MDRNGEYLVVEMDVELSRLEVEANRAVLLTPRLVNGADSADLSAIGIYGRRRYYYYMRNGAGMLSGDGETSFKAAEKPERVAYHVIVPYAEWMNGAALRLSAAITAAATRCSPHSRACWGTSRNPVPYTPRPVYVRPAAETVKKPLAERVRIHRLPGEQDRHLPRLPPQYGRTGQDRGHHRFGTRRPGRDHHVGMAQRLRIARKSVDAQPHAGHRPHRSAEKAYRTALPLRRRDHQTDYEPEDWAGLRSYVERSNLTHRAEILALIDSSLEPDAKEAKIKRSYPDEYDFLLKNCYPALRHTDYRITYTVRTFSDAQEIRRIMLTQPQKLSLNEFYLAAQACSPGSDEFNEIFETAVRMYPEDTAANLNAANTAMQKGDLKNAEHYLRKAGESPEALYARGAYAMLTEGSTKRPPAICGKPRRPAYARPERLWNSCKKQNKK